MMFSKKMFYIQFSIIFIAFVVFGIGVAVNIQYIGEFGEHATINLYKTVSNFEVIEFGNRTVYYTDLRNIASILLVFVALPITVGFLLPAGTGFSLPTNAKGKSYLKLAMISSLLLILLSVCPVVMFYDMSNSSNGEYFLNNFLYYSELLGIVTLSIIYIVNFVLLIVSYKFVFKQVN